MEDELALIIRRLREIHDPLGLLGALFVRSRAAVVIWAPDGRQVLHNPAFRAIMARLGRAVRDSASEAHVSSYEQHVEARGSEREHDVEARGSAREPNKDDLIAQLGAAQLYARALAGETVSVGPIWFDARSPSSQAPDQPARIAIEGNLLPLQDREGQVAHVAGVFRDMTADLTLRAREAQFHEAEARLHTMLDNLPLALVSMDREGRYTHVEGRRLREMRLNPADLIGRSAFELSKDQPATLDALKRALAGESVTVRGDSRAGGTYESRIVPHYDAHGEVLGLTAVSYDVTEQDDAERALRASEERLRSALIAGRLATIEVDLRHGSCHVSENAQDMFGASTEQLSSLENALLLIHPDDRATVRDLLATMREQGTSTPNVQYRIVRPDNGEIIWLERRLQIKREPDGQVVGATGLLIDITERKRADEADARTAELTLDNRRMAEASRLKSEFLANMSHELRTPLNAILGFAELLHDGHVPPNSPRHREFLGDILSSGQHLLRLINDVLDLAKVEAGKQDFCPEPVVLADLIAEVRSALEPSAQAKQLRLDTELDPALSVVTLDPARFKQVLFNYLSNAVKFTPCGGHVIVRTVGNGDQTFRLEVQDTGIGIAPSDVTRLFSEFQQLEAGANKKHQGTGLGLVLTRKLVEAQGGSVGVESELGRGSTFVAILPTA